MRTLTLLGATGSIGDSTLDVVARHPDRFRVAALAAQPNWDKLARLCRTFRPRYAALQDAARGARAGAGARGATACRRACWRVPRDSPKSPRCPRSTRCSRRSSARRDSRRRSPPRAPASASCSPTRKRWSWAARCSCDAVAEGGAVAAADRQRAQRDLPVPAARATTRDPGRARRSAHPAHRVGRAVPHARARRACRT